MAEAGLLWHDHLRKRHPVEDGALRSLVVEGDVIKHETLPVVEADVELPILPLHLTSRPTDIKGHALRLGDLQGLQVSPVASLALDGNVVVVQWRGLDKRPADLRNVEGNDGLLDGIPDGAEIQGILILTVVHFWSVVDQCLLQAPVATEPFVISERPGVTVDLVHVLLRDAADDALLYDLGVLSKDLLDRRELLWSNLVSVSVSCMLYASALGR